MLIDKHIIKQKLLKAIPDVNSVSTEPLKKDELITFAENIAEQLAEVYALIDAKIEEK